MIAEFVFDSVKIVLSFHFNFDAIYGIRKHPVCYQCRKYQRAEAWQKHGHYLAAGVRMSSNRVPRSLIGWMNVDGRSIQGGPPPDDPKDAELREKVVDYFLSSLRPKIFHAYGKCERAWMRDRKVHPGIKIRYAAYSILDRLKWRLKKFEDLRRGKLFRIYEKARALATNPQESHYPRFLELQSLICVLERSRKNKKS